MIRTNKIFARYQLVSQEIAIFPYENYVTIYSLYFHFILFEAKWISTVIPPHHNYNVADSPYTYIYIYIMWVLWIVFHIATMLNTNMCVSVHNAHIWRPWIFHGNRKKVAAVITSAPYHDYIPLHKTNHLLCLWYPDFSGSPLPLTWPHYPLGTKSHIPRTDVVLLWALSMVSDTNTGEGRP